VLSNGNSAGDIVGIPTGGHCIPKSIVGFSAECRYAQNNEANINISLTTNNRNPWLSPRLTAKV
jgi:hypothetical protein